MAISGQGSDRDTPIAAIARAWGALRWQLWVRAFAVAGLAENLIYLVFGNGFGKSPAWSLRLCSYQLDHDRTARPWRAER